MKTKTTLELAMRLNEILKSSTSIELEQIRLGHNLNDLTKEWNEICLELWNRIPSLSEDSDIRPKIIDERPDGGKVMYEFRIYVFREFGYELAETTKDESVIDTYVRRKKKDYSKLLVIRHDIEKNMDQPYYLKFFDGITYAPKTRTRRKPSGSTNGESRS